ALHRAARPALRCTWLPATTQRNGREPVAGMRQEQGKQLMISRSKSALNACAALALSACATMPTPQGAITLARQGSFEAGGRFLGDPASSSLACDHGHVEYQIPVQA